MEEKASAESAFSRVATESEMGGDDNTRLVFESDSESSDDEEEEDDTRGEDAGGFEISTLVLLIIARTKFSEFSIIANKYTLILNLPS